jgi:sigma-70-like protein
MTTSLTNYTTYDLAYYYADLRRLPCLSREERQHLVTGLSVAHSIPAALPEAQLKQQVIESYLPLAKHLAIALCPPTRYRRLLPELIGAVNLAVVEAVMRSDLSSTLSLDAYVAAYVRAAIKRTLSTDELLPIPVQARVRAQVDTLLSYLSPRAQAILRLRYGLLDANERCHSTIEIAALLSITRGLVLTTERDALARLRAFVAGEATLGQQNGKPCICYPAAHNTASIPLEQEAALLAVCRDLSAHGVIVTGRALSSGWHQPGTRAHLLAPASQRDARRGPGAPTPAEAGTGLRPAGSAGGARHQSAIGTRSRGGEANGYRLPHRKKEDEPCHTIIRGVGNARRRKARSGRG